MVEAMFVRPADGEVPFASYCDFKHVVVHNVSFFTGCMDSELTN